MTTPAIQGNNAYQPSPRQGDAGSQGARTGTFRNETLQVVDQKSALLNAAEEISMHFSGKVEELEHDERQIDGPAAITVMRIEQITAYLDAAKLLDGPDKMAGLVKLAERMLKSGQESPSQLARQGARDRHNPTEEFVLLQFALEHGRSHGASREALDQIELAIEDLETFKGPQIRAGLNTIVAAADWAESGEDIGRFQQAYRDVALGGLKLSDTLKIVMERISGKAGERFESGLRNLIAAVGADLAATRPSIDDTARLKTLRDDMYDLTVMNSMLESCLKVVTTIRNRTNGAA